MGSSCKLNVKNEPHEYCYNGQGISDENDVSSRQSIIRRTQNLDGLYKSNVLKVIFNFAERVIKSTEIEIFDIYLKSAKVK